MKTLSKITLFLALLFSYYIHSQEVLLNVQVTPPYQLRIEEYTNSPDNILLQLTNLNDDVQRIKFRATLTGNNGVTISTVGNPPNPYILESMATQIITGTDIDDLYLGFDEDDIIISGASPLARENLIKYRVLPEGQYTLCIQALDFETSQPLSTPSSGCATFEIIHPERPIITTPIQDQEIIENTTPVITFSWTHPVGASPELLARLNYTLKIGVVRRNENENPEQVMTNPNTNFIVHERNIVGNTFTVEEQVLSSFYAPNSQIAIMVTAEDEAGEIPIQNRGQSEVVTFNYIQEKSISKDFNLLSAVYPENEDTLPFTKVMCIVEVEEGVEVESRANYQRMVLNDMYIRNDKGDDVYNREDNDENNWRSAGGIRNYMERNVGGNPSPRYYQFWVNKTEDYEAHKRGETYQWRAIASFPDDPQLGSETFTTTSSFKVGMTQPIPNFPENESQQKKGEIQFQFRTGMPPKRLLPEYDIMRISGGIRSGNRQTSFGKTGRKRNSKDKEVRKLNEVSEGSRGSVTVGQQYGINERYVFQLSRNNDFTNVIKTFSEHLSYEMTSDDYGLAREVYIKNLIYKDVQVPYTITENGTYYWRIVYLNDPELPSERFKNLTQDDYYESSNLFSFTVGTENGIVLENPRNNSTINVPTNPQFRWRLPNIENKDNTQFSGELQLIDITDVPIETSIDTTFFQTNTTLKRLYITGNATSWNYSTTNEDPTKYRFPSDNEKIILTPERRYAVLVKGQYVNDQDKSIANGGYSNINKFWYREGSPESNSDCRSELLFALTDENAVTNLGDISSFTAGYFTVENIRNLQNNSGTYSGEGVVRLPIMGNLPVAVRFENVQLNASSQLVAGEVLGKENEAFIGNLPRPDANNDLQSLVSDGSLTSWLDGAPTPNIDDLTTIGLPLKHEPEIGGRKVAFGITGVKFEKNIAYISLAHEMHLGKFAGVDNQWFGSVFTTALTPNGFGFEDTVIGPSRDMQLGAGGGTEWAFKIKKAEIGTEEINGTHIKLTCNGVESFRIDAEVHFPTNILVKNLENGDQGPANDPVIGKFSFKFIRGQSEPNPGRSSSKDIMVAFTMDEFQIKGVKGWGFRLDRGYVDLSALENPQDFSFPDDYQHSASLIPEGTDAEMAANITNSWKGFFLKELSIKAPKDFYKAAGDRQFISGVRNLLIDETGFSANFFAENIIDINKGQIEKFAFSLDRVNINILQNAFLSGDLSGEFAIPISKNNERGRVGYEAILAYTIPEAQQGMDAEFTDREWGFFMNVQTRNDMVIPIPMLMAEATLAENSYVRVKLGEASFSESALGVDIATVEDDALSLYLNGNMSISSNNTESSDDGSVFSNLATSLDFSGIDFELKYNSATGMDSSSRIAFASPQKLMGGYESDSSEGSISGGFNVTITEVTFNNVQPVFDELLKKNFCLEMSASVGLSMSLMNSNSGGFEASTNLTFNARFFDDSQSNGFNRVFKLTGVDIDCIEIGASTGSSEQNGVTFAGQVCFFKDNPTYGNGMGGKLHIGLPVADVHMASIFGVAPKTGGGTFNYWFVDGKAIFDKGITMGSLQLLGLGGGIYWNMELENTNTTTVNSDTSQGEYDSNLVSNAASMQETTSADNQNIPEGKNFGQQFTGTLSGLVPRPSNGSKVFKLMLPIASEGDKSVFNMDVGVTLAFGGRRGLTQFTIVGNGYVMTEPTTEARRDAPVNLDVLIDFQKDDTYSLFDATIAVYADVDFGGVVYVRGVSDATSYDGAARKQFVKAQFFVQDFKDRDSNEDITYFKLGSPQEPGGLEAGISDALKLSVRNYLQIGNNLDTGFMELPSLITEVFSKSNIGSGGRLQGGNVTAIDRVFPPMESSRKGFIMGLQSQLDLSLRVFILKASLGIAFGFDLNMLKYENDQKVCYGESGNVYDPFGIDGWYATGQMYAGVRGKISIYINLFFFKAEFDLFELGAAFLIQGGFPNPVWGEGKAAAYYAVLGGKIKGSANFNFSFGDRCRPPRTDPFGFPIIEDVIPNDGDRDISPFTDVAASFAIPIDRDFEIPVEIGEGDDARMDVATFKPYIDSFTIKSDGNAIQTKPIDYREGNGVAKLIPTEVLTPNKNAKVSINVKAWKKEGNNYVQAKIPEGPRVNEVWEESKTNTFRVGSLPDRIPEEYVRSSTPVKNQRFFLKGENQRGAVHFYRNLRNSYFSKPTETTYRTADNGREYPVETVFLVRFYSLDGTQKIDKPLNVYNNRVTFEIPQELQNDQVYTLNIIKKEKLGGTYEYDKTLQNIANSTKPLASDYGINTYENILSSEHVGRLNDLYIEAQIKKRSHTLIPGRTELSDETILLTYPFRTSKYNTVLEKVQSCTNVSRNSAFDNQVYDEFNVENATAVNVTCGEAFDEFDVYGKQTTDGIVRDQDRNGTNSYWHRPTFSFSPEVRGTNFWYRKGSRLYGVIKTFTNQMNNTYSKRGTNESTWVSNPRKGEVTVNVANTSHKIAIQKLPVLNEYDLAISNESEYYSLMRFNRFKRGVKGYLTENEIMGQAQQYARERLGTTSNSSSNNQTSIDEYISNRLSLASNNSAFDNRVAEAMENYNPNTLTLMYDLHRGVSNDYSRLWGLFYGYDYRIFTYNSQEGVSSIGGRVVQDQMRNKLGRNYDTFKDYILNNNANRSFRATDNLGTYKLRIGKYLFEDTRASGNGAYVFPGVVKSFTF